MIGQVMWAVTYKNTCCIAAFLIHEFITIMNNEFKLGKNSSYILWNYYLILNRFDYDIQLLFKKMLHVPPTY